MDAARIRAAGARGDLSHRAQLMAGVRRFREARPLTDSKDAIPPRDSLMTIAPGAQVTIDARLGAEWTRRTQECRQIRGNVLAKCFEIEYVLDQVIAETFVPTVTANPEGQSLLDALLLKGPMTFRTKIDVLRKLRTRVVRLQTVLPEDVLAELTSVRETRNDFAHYPVTFEPVGDPPNQTLSPVLISRRGRFPLDDAFLREQSEIFGRVLAGLENAFKSLKPAEAPAGQRAEQADEADGALR